jgi:hypothetical protein
MYSIRNQKHHRLHVPRFSWRLVASAVLILAILATVIISRQPQTSSKSTSAAHSTVKSSNTQTNPPIVAPDKAYGIAAGSGLPGLSDADLDKRLQGISELGATWVRLDFDWSNIQSGGASNYNWAPYDKIVAAAAKYNLKVLGIITYTPAWARASDCQGDMKCHPAHPEQFAQFAGTVSHRYQSQGLHYWEIWNEPNSKDFWKPKASPTDYAELLKQSYQAIKQQDVAAVVITAGLSPQATNDVSYAPKDFFAALYKAGAKPYFDAAADHPYTFPLSPTSSHDHAWNQMAVDTDGIRQTMVRNGDAAKKVWITEFGAPTGGPGPISTISNPNLDAGPYVVDEPLQAKILSDAFTLYRSYDWVGPFFVYSYQDAGTDQSSNENFFGLVRADGSHKPAYDVFKQAAATPLP